VSQPSSPQSDRLIGQIIAERYQILSVLGEGGMGRVYLAEHVRMGRKSAVKVLSPNMALSADAISRFNREAANASRINHPNVVQIYDFGETPDGMLYLAMEFVEGETLRSLIQRDGPLPVARAAELSRQIADALGAAHYLGIVHRDLKPDNILLTRHHDGTDWVKVVDFGIAKTVQGSGGENRGSQTVTTAGVSLGTPEYMSPEQLAGERLDARTDLYSLGLVLFNMLTANLPYPRVTSKETLVRRLTSRPQTLAEVAAWGEWSPQIQAVLDRALAPEPEDRYASVREFGREVVAATSTGDTTVRIPAGRPMTGPTERITTARRTRPTATRPARKRSLAVAGALIVLIAVGAGAFVAMRDRSSSVTTTSPPAVAPATQLSAVVPRDTTTAIARDSSAVTAHDTIADSFRAPRSATAPRVDSAKRVTAPAKTLGSSPKTTLVSARSSPPPGADTSASLALPAPPPVNPADTTPANRDKTMSRLRHPMLRASGDSASRTAMPTTDPDRIRVLGEDIQGHLARAMQFIRQGDILKARGEVREMGPVVGVLRQLYGGTPGEARVEQMLRTGVGQSLAACRIAIQDSVSRAKLPPTFRCEQLVPQGMRGQRVGRNLSAQPWNR
jgi:hypothetical protein